MVVVGQEWGTDRIRLAIYSNRGKFERGKIKLDEGNGRSVRGITVSMEGRIVVALEDVRFVSEEGIVKLFPNTNDAESTSQVKSSQVLLCR